MAQMTERSRVLPKALRVGASRTAWTRWSTASLACATGAGEVLREASCLGGGCPQCRPGLSRDWTTSSLQEVSSCLFREQRVPEFTTTAT